MSRQKRTQGPSQTALDARAPAESQPAHDPSLQQQVSLGNSALQQRMDADGLAEQAVMQSAAGLARTVVEHASLVLQLTGVQDLARQVAILEGSRLERKQELMERIQADADRVSAVDAVLDEWVGAHDDAARWMVDDALNDVMVGLSGAPGGAGWIVGDTEVALGPDARAGGAVERAGHLVSDVAAATSGLDGPVVRGLCLALQRAVALREEEEEDWFEPAPELG